MNTEDKQCLLRVTGHYKGPVDGMDGPRTKEAVKLLVADLGYVAQTVQDNNVAAANDGSMILVFSLAADGNKYLTEHFQVREFACNDGSDVVLIHPLLPVWAEALRTINGSFSPNSAYRTVSYNASIGGAALSKHCQGIAMDIPAKKATVQELYDLALTLVGDSGGLGLYDWGIHIDCRPIKSRWDYRKAA